MSQSLFIASPFIYSENPNKNVITEIGPDKTEQDALGDINRHLDVCINGKSIRAQREQTCLTADEFKLYHLSTEEGNIEAIKQLAEQILKGSPTDTEKKYLEDLIKSETLQDIKNHFANYEDELLNKKIRFDNINEFEKFLKNHLLNNVTDDKMQQFMANNIAMGFHQSGLARAADAYFNKIAGNEIESFKETTKILLVCDPKPLKSINFTCTNNIVTIENDLKYRSLQIVDKEGNPSMIKKADNDYFAHVNSKIHIQIGKLRSASEKGQFVINLKGDPLLINLHKCQKNEAPDKETQNIANNFFEKVFDHRTSTIQKIIDYIVEAITGKKPTVAARPENELANPDASPRPRV